MFVLKCLLFLSFYSQVLRPFYIFLSRAAQNLFRPVANLARYVLDTGEYSHGKPADSQAKYTNLMPRLRKALPFSSYKTSLYVE